MNTWSEKISNNSYLDDTVRETGGNMAGKRSWYAELERQQRRQAAEAERARKAALAAQRAHERETLKQYQAERKRVAEEKTTEVEERIAELTTMLRNEAKRPPGITFSELRTSYQEPELDLGPVGTALAAPDWSQYAPKPLGFLQRLFASKTAENERLGQAQAAFALAQGKHDRNEQARVKEVQRLLAEHEQEKQQARQDVEQHNKKIEELAEKVSADEPTAVAEYLELVVGNVPLPAGFPSNFEVTYSSKQQQALVQFEMPGPDIVPAVRSFKYVQSKDQESENARPAKEIADIYQNVVSQLALVCIRAILLGFSKVQSVGFNGHVWTTNPATGKREFPCLISLVVERSAAENIDFAHVVPQVCLKALNALVSPHPYAVEPIVPILEFDLTKFSFVEGLDAVSSLDSRPDLMQQNPTEFEHLVRQVFEARGLTGWTTTQNYDDGVDAVVVNSDALVGGLAIVQAKRYSNAIGVNHIRELSGAIDEKRAGRGILVTTSWFTQICWQKAKENGRIELIDGPRLVHLIKEYLAKDVVIGIDRKKRRKTGG